MAREAGVVERHGRIVGAALTRGFFWVTGFLAGTTVLFAVLTITILAFFLFPEYRYWYLLVSFILYVLVVTEGHDAEITDFFRHVIEAVVSIVLAVGLVLWIRHERRDEWEIYEYGITAALAIIFTGLSLITKSAHKLKQATLQAEIAAKSVQRSADKSEAASAEISELLRQIKGEFDKAQLATLAAQALGISEKAASDKNLKLPIRAALGTIRTWAEGGLYLFGSTSARAGQADNGDGPQREPGGAERAWWRSLRAYHNEERYDLARFEIVTNARNYTYVLTSVIDELCDHAGYPADNGRDRESAGAEPSTTQTRVVVVQGTTFPPKDFYNFPDGPRGARLYRDFQFYGTYRRVISLMNRQRGVLPHRIIFVLNHEQRDGEEATTLDAMGWRLDTQADVKRGASRLFCAPYSLPDSGVQGVARVYAQGWSDADRQAALQEDQVCPVVPYLDSYASEDDWPDFAKRAKKHAENLAGQSRSDIAQLLAADPLDAKMPDVVAFLRDRECLAWKSTVEAAAEALGGLYQTSLIWRPLSDCFEEIKEHRSSLTDLVAKPEIDEDTIVRAVRRLLPATQNFDALCAELKERGLVEHNCQWGDWSRLRSGGKIALGPAEAWLYFLMNLVDGAVFEASSEGAKLVPLWKQFRRDFLGGISDHSFDEEGKWGKKDPATRIRFVPVAPGNRAGEIMSDGVVSAAAFDEKDLGREFILIGTVDGEPDQSAPFAGVKWQVLVTSEIAPPFRTCRLNFCFNLSSPGSDSNLLDQHRKWVEAAWTATSEKTKAMLGEIEGEIDKVAAARASKRATT